MQYFYFEPDLEKIVQSLNWFCFKNNKALNKMKAIKLLFFADRYHLRKYGRLITSDTYYALQYGTVGSLTKDILNENKISLGKYELDYVKEYIKNMNLEYHLKKLPNYKLLSDSDIEALEFSYNNFNKFPEFQLSNITHDYPEWKQYQNYFTNSTPEKKRFPVKPSCFFQNPEINKSPYIKKYLNKNDPFADIDAENLECNKQLFLESLEIEKIWDL